jgi:hypothetical protein
MTNTNQFDNLILKRQINISKFLNTFFPKDISKLISEYDYYLEGISYTFTEYDTYIRCIVVLPGGPSGCCFAAERIVVGSGKQIKVWNLDTGKCDIILTGHTLDVNCIASLPVGPSNYLADGAERIVSGSNDRTLKIWNLLTGKCEITLIGHLQDVCCITVIYSANSPFEWRVVSGSKDGIIKIWNISKIKFQELKSDECENTFKAHNHIVSCLAVLPDGRLVSGSFDGTIKVWNMNLWNTTKEISQIYNCDITLVGYNILCDITFKNTSWINCIVALSDGRIVIGSFDNKIKIWNLQTGQLSNPKGKCNNILVKYNHCVIPVYITECLAVLPDGRIIGGPLDKTIKIWNLSNNTSKSSSACHVMSRDPVYDTFCIAVLPDGRVITASNDKKIKIWS